MNKDICALILKRVVISLHIDFPSQKEMRSTLEGTERIRKLGLFGTGVQRAQQKKWGEG